MPRRKPQGSRTKKVLYRRLTLSISKVVSNENYSFRFVRATPFLFAESRRERWHITGWEVSTFSGDLVRKFCDFNVKFKTLTRRRLRPVNPELSNQELLELDDLCGRFEKEWRPDSDLLQAYLSRASERQLPFLIRELVGLECELLRTTGRESSCDGYRKRHPKWQREIDSACDACTLKGVRGDTKPLHPQQLGDYRILREIGRGSSGIVYEAVQESLGRSVAIKVLTSYALLIPEAIERFQRESRAVAALHHSNIVQVYGTGKQDDLHYFAMQMVDGVSIDHLARGHQKAKAKVATPQNDIGELLPSQTKNRCSFVANVGFQVASALSYAHSRGILHRDIKPANLLFDGVTVWVTDFGLAKINREESDATQTGDLIGTLRYLPPEAVTGTWDQRGDLYSLGLTLYELLTLQPAFKDRDRTVLLNKITKGEPPTSPRQIDRTIPRDIETVVMKAIAHDPSDRYQSADDMARDLQLFLDGEPILARRQSAFERLRKWTYRNPALAALVALITLLVTVGLPSVASLWLSAEVARESAETQRDYADAVGYGSSMQLAQSFIEQRKPNEVRSLLAKWNSHSITGLEKKNRNTPLAWEWNYLNSQVNASNPDCGNAQRSGLRDCRASRWQATRHREYAGTRGGWRTSITQCHDLGFELRQNHVCAGRSRPWSDIYYLQS